MKYIHKYYTKNDYYIVEVLDNGNMRIIDDPEHYLPYQEWLSQGNIPTKESGDRFISIVNDEVVEDPNKNEILAEEYKEVLKREIKENAREIIAEEVGDDKDLIADLSKRLDIIERGFVRLLAHILGGTQMTPEYISRYLNYAETIIAMVENEQYKPRADLEDESQLIQKLITRQNIIGQIVKEHYFDELRKYNLLEE